MVASKGDIMVDPIEADLVNALKALDFKAPEAKSRAKKAIECLGPEAPLGALVKEALKRGHGGVVEVVPVAPEPATASEEASEDEDEEDVEEELAEAEEEMVRLRESHASLPRRSRQHITLRPPPRQKRERFHWVYALSLGWWVAILVLLLRLALYGVETLFELETKKEPSVKGLFGWW